MIKGGRLSSLRKHDAKWKWEEYFLPNPLDYGWIERFHDDDLNEVRSDVKHIWNEYHEIFEQAERAQREASGELYDWEDKESQFDNPRLSYNRICLRLNDMYHDLIEETRTFLCMKYNMKYLKTISYLRELWRNNE